MRRAGLLLAVLVTAAFLAAPPVVAHEVAPGETLWEIAARYGLSPGEVAAANNIADADLIGVGTVLAIPGPDGQGTRTPGSVYVVREGDTLAGVAEAFGTTVADVVAGNDIADPNFVVVGQHLHVPGSPQAGLVEAAPPVAVPPPADRAEIEAALVYWADRNGIDANLAKGLAWHESGWQQDVVSSTGAMGVMQLMPSAVDHIRSHLIGVPELDPFVMDQNVRMGVRYLDQLLIDFGGDERLALASYYQGERAVRELGLYGETEQFVANVLANRDHFAGG